MDITSAVFAKGVTNQTNLIEDGLPQVAFIGRSNVGKSSLINSLTNNKSLARSSSTPGRTQEINFFLINKNSFYLVDLPGYGYAEGSTGTRQEILNRIKWYLFESGVNHKKIFLVIDAKVGFTDHDLQMFNLLVEHDKNFIVIANKIDKLNMSEKHKSLTEIHKITGDHLVIPYSSDKKIGREKILEALEM